MNKPTHTILAAACAIASLGLFILLDMLTFGVGFYSLPGSMRATFHQFYFAFWIAAPILGIYACKLFFPADWSWRTALLGFIFIAASVWYGNISYNHSLPTPDEVGYHSHAEGNCNRVFRGVLSTKAGSFVWRHTLSAFLDPTLQTAYLALEDACRIVKMRSAFEKENSQLCQNIRIDNTFSCFIAVQDQATEKAPYTATGYTLAEALGLILIDREKERREAHVGRARFTEKERIQFGLEIAQMHIDTLIRLKLRRRAGSLVGGAENIETDDIPPKVMKEFHRRFAKAKTVKAYLDLWKYALMQSRGVRKELMVALDDFRTEEASSKYLAISNQNLRILEREIRQDRSPASFGREDTLAFLQEVEKLKRQLNSLKALTRH